MPVTIVITHAYKGGKLKMVLQGTSTNAFEVKAPPATEIRWVPTANIVIHKIKEKYLEPDVFDYEPQPGGAPRMFTTILKNQAYTRSEYYIEWYFNNSSKIETFDPIMTIKPDRLKHSKWKKYFPFLGILLGTMALVISGSMLQNLSNKKKSG